jgi:chitinase
MPEAEQRKDATCSFLKRTYSVRPMESWGNLTDSLLRQWWEANDCNRRVVATPGPSVHFDPLPPTHHQFCQQTVVGEKQKDLVNTVYFTSYGTSALQADFEGIHRVCYAFLGIDSNGQLTGADSVNSQQLLTMSKLRFPIKVLASVGGWGNCSNFSSVFGDPELMQRCVDSCLAVMATRGYDGIDLDWEFPSGPDDPKNMVRFLRRLREAAPNALLTIAASSNIGYYRAIAADLTAILDTVYVMTYDYIGPWGSVSGHNSSVGDSLVTINSFIQAGFPPGKLAIGSAWYARTCQVTNTANNGLGQTSLSGEWLEMTYHEAVTEYLGRRGFTRYWDAAKEAVWLFNPTARTFISYEDETMVRVKRTQAKLKGLQGIFCWSFAQDSKGILKKALIGGI